MDRSTRRQIRQEEMFCHMDFGIKPETPKSDIPALLALQERQKDTIRKLADVFAQGGENVAVDLYKAAQYKEMLEAAEAAVGGTFTTANFYAKTSKYNHIRIMAIRLNLLAKFFLKQNFLPKWAPFLGLLYGPMFLFDLGVVLKNTFNPKRTKAEQEFQDEHGYFALIRQRFKNAMLKDDRISRMFNSGFWFPINFLTSAVITTLIVGSVIVASPIADIVMAAATGVDLLHEIIVGAVDYYRHRRYANEVKKTLASTEKELTDLLELPASEDPIENEKRTTKIAELQQKTIELRLESKGIEKQTHEMLVGRGKHFAKSLVILTGLAMMLFPPTLIPGAILTTIGVAISIGSWLYERKKNAKKAAHDKIEVVDVGTQTDDLQVENNGLKNTFGLTEAMKSSVKNQINSLDGGLPPVAEIPLTTEQQNAVTKLPDELTKIPVNDSNLSSSLPEKGTASQLRLWGITNSGIKGNSKRSETMVANESLEPSATPAPPVTKAIKVF